MEKHQIDKLFANQLRDVEKTPRPEAWERLHGRLESQRRRRIGLWWYAAAASVLVATLAGWWMLKPIALEPTIAQHTGMPTKSATKQEKMKPNALDNQQTAQNSVAATNTVSIVHAKAGHINKIEQKATKPRQIEMLPTVLEPKSEQQIAQTNVPKNTESPVVNQTIDEKIKTALTEQPIVAKVEPKLASQTLEGNTTIVMNMNESKLPMMEELQPTIESDKTKKTSRVARIFKQLKNAKDGEKVDWKEVGFNPNRLLARADEKWEDAPRRK